jgi:hypothetical protein
MLLECTACVPGMTIALHGPDETVRLCRCTDWPVLLLFVVFCTPIFTLQLVAFARGDPDEFIYGNSLSGVNCGSRYVRSTLLLGLQMYFRQGCKSCMLGASGNLA